MSIAATLAALYPDAPVIELRVLYSNSAQVDSGYFNDYTRLEKIASALNGSSQIYYTINPCKPALIARAHNRLQQRAKTTTVDHDIDRRCYFPIDLDPVRPAGISASEAEHKQAFAKAKQIKAWLTEQGWEEPIELDSGNGAYLIYPIDLPNDIASKELLEQCLKALDMLFSDNDVKVDTTMYNAARIVRLPGTKNTKGDSTEDRPHRLAQIITLPEQRRSIPLALLAQLAASLPQAPKPNEVAPKFDFGLWLAQEQIEIAKVDRWSNAMMYTLAHCAFNAEHKGAAIFVFDNGGYEYKCFHDSCSDKHWKDFKKLHSLPTMGESPSAKTLAMLNNLGYFFKLNLCADRIEVNGVTITDPLLHKVKVQMYDKGVKSMGFIESVIHANALDNSYHPVKKYLAELTYDNTRDYIRELADHFYDVHDPIDGETVAYTWLKHWLVGAVAKVFEAEQNPMLVLAGDQGIGKSEFARYLAGGLPNYFIESDIKPDRADDKLRLIQSWLWEVAELGATTRKADIEGLKSFITMRYVTVRRPYGTFDMHKPAMASMIGTVNIDGAGFLVDSSGNRRFLTMELRKIDWDYQKIPVNMVWAQAMAMYQAGYDWKLKVDEKEQQKVINKRYEISDPYVDLLETHFEINPNDDHWLSSITILDTLRNSGLLGGGTLKAQAMELSKAASTLKLVKQRRGGVQGYLGIRQRTTLTLTIKREQRKETE